MTKKTVKKRLSDVSFEHEGAHVALVCKDQGGPANGVDHALILKSTKQVELEKAQQVQVTLELPEFLRKFFGLWYEDAEILARLMGYVPPEPDNEVKTYEDYIEEKVASFTILKSLQNSDNLNEAIASLSSDDLTLVQKDAQALSELLVKAKNSAKDLSKSSAGEGSTEALAKAKVSDDKTNAEVEPSGKNSTTENKEMEMIEKAAAVAMVEKAVEEIKTELQKAQDELAVLKKEKAEAIAKSRKDALVAVLKDEAKAEELFKAVGALGDAEFNAVVESMSQLNKAVEQSGLFEEKGVTATELTKSAEKKQSGVSAILEAELAKKAK